jgi:8-hydroxy-5-deazaflavin:NADPH oxidoreductase
VRIAIVGGTGPFGRGLAMRLADTEHEIVLGSRDADRAAAAALELDCVGLANSEACSSADFVVFAVNADAVLDTARELRAAIGSKPVLSVASQLRFTKTAVFPSPDAKSLAEQLQDHLDGPVLAGLHSLAAASLAGEEPPDEDAFVCGDDRSAKEVAIDLAERLVSGRALDAGPLASARALEGMTAVIVNLNRRYKAHAGLRATGID